jgi:hypothetical protein
MKRHHDMRVRNIPREQTALLSGPIAGIGAAPIKIMFRLENWSGATERAKLLVGSKVPLKLNVVVFIRWCPIFWARW